MNKKNPLLNVGWSLMLMMFIALLLTTFSVLSVVTSQSQLDLSKKFAYAQTSYYEGNSKANKILMDIDKTLFDIQNSSSMQEYNLKSYNALKNNENLTCNLENGVSTVSFSVPCNNEINDINVILSLENCGGLNQPRYKILSWTLINNTEDVEEYIETDVHWWGE